MAKFNSIGLFQNLKKVVIHVPKTSKKKHLDHIYSWEYKSNSILAQICVQGGCQKLEHIFEYIKDKGLKQHSYDNIRIFNSTLIFIIMSSHTRALELAGKKNLSSDEKQEIITLMRTNGINMPDCMFQNAYSSYSSNPKSNQKYIQLEELIYNGLQLKLDKGFLKKFVLHFKKKIGDNTYIRRLNRFVHYITNPEVDVTPIQELIREDLSDNETLKKTITSFKREGKIDEYIERINKYLSIEPLDQEAWIQLAEIYTEKGHYMKAAFCYEQLMIINPANDVYALKLSELYLTVGNKAMAEKAIKYLSYLISKKPDNLRALWILYRAILGQEQYQQLKQTCSDAINMLYSKRNQALKIHIAL